MGTLGHQGMGAEATNWSEGQRAASARPFSVALSALCLWPSPSGLGTSQIRPHRAGSQTEGKDRKHGSSLILLLFLPPQSNGGKMNGSVAWCLTGLDGDWREVVDLQRRGIGSRLIQEAISSAMDSGFNFVYTYTTSDYSTHSNFWLKEHTVRGHKLSFTRVRVSGEEFRGSRVLEMLKMLKILGVVPQ